MASSADLDYVCPHCGATVPVNVTVGGMAGQSDGTWSSTPWVMPTQDVHLCVPDTITDPTTTDPTDPMQGS